MKITLNEIRTAYYEDASKVKTDKAMGFWAFHISRRTSFYPAWLCLRMGISGNQVTAMSFLIGLGGCSMIALGDIYATILGIMLLHMWIWGDDVDGLVARCSGKTSVLGGFIDDWNVCFVHVLSIISIGVGLSKIPDSYGEILIRTLFNVTPDRNIYLVIGLYASFIYTLYRWFRTSATYITTVKKRTNVVNYQASILKNTFSHVYSTTNPHGLYIPALLLVTIFGIMSLFLIFLTIIHTIHIIGYAIFTFRRLKEL